MVIINPVPLPPYGGRAYNHITPFTYRDGLTFVEVLEQLRAYIRDVVVPHVDVSFDDLEAYIDSAVGETQTWTQDAIASMVDYVNSQVDLILNESIEVQDPLVAAMLSDTGSASRGVTDGLYAEKATENAVSAINSTLNGRLSAGTLDATFEKAESVSSLIPPGLGWDYDYPLAPRVVGAGHATKPYADAGITADGLFDLFSTARSAPTTTFYVSTNGDNLNTGLSKDQAVRSIHNAIVKANATGQPTKIMVEGGLYFRPHGFWNLNEFLTVDCAFETYNGRAVVTVADTFTALEPDVTYPNCYRVSVGNVERVMDIANLNAHGHYTELSYAPDFAACDATPNSWAFVDGVLRIHRADGQPVTESNTRYYRSSENNLTINQQINVWIDGFDLEGSSRTSPLHIALGSAAATKKVVVANDSTFRYGGGYGAGSPTPSYSRIQNGVTLQSWAGLGAFFHCDASANMRDGFNAHNNFFSENVFMLTVGCTGIDNGRDPRPIGGAINGSCNGSTLHEDYIGIDIGSYFLNNRGGTVHNIGNSKQLLLGTVIQDDLGDVVLGSSMPPSGVRASENAEIWCEQVSVLLRLDGRAYSSVNPGSAIHRRNCLPVPNADYGPGTFDSY